MKKNPVVVGLLSILLLAGSAGQIQAATPIIPGASAGGAKAWVPPFAAASASTLAGVQRLLQTDMGRGLLEQNPSLQVLLRLSPACEAHLRIMGAMGLVESLGVEGLAAVLAERYAQSEAQLEQAISARVAELAAAVDQKAIGADELHAAADELAPFLLVPGVAGKVRGVLQMSGAALADKTMAGAARIAALLMRDMPIPQDESALFVAAAEEDSQAARELAQAKDLMSELQRETSRGNREEVAGRLGRLGLESQSEAAQRLIVRGLLEDTRRPDEPAIDTSYDARVIGVVKSITAKTRFDTVSELAIVMIGANANWINSPHNRALIAAMESIALSSTDRVKDLTIGILSRKAGAGLSEWFSADSKRFLAGEIDALKRSKTAAEVPPPAAEPRPVASGFGIAALLASVIPVVVGIGAFFGPITMGGMALTPVGQAILLAVGVPLLAAGIRIMRANGRSRSMDDTGFAGFLVGMAVIFLELPALRALITGDMSLPLNTLIAAGMIAATALASLAVDKVGAKHAGKATPWVAVAAYIVGVAAMILGGARFGAAAVAVGFGFILAAGFGSLFLGSLWRAVKAAWAAIKDKKPDMSFMGRWLPKLGFAPQGLTPQAGALIGFLVGLFLALAFIKVSAAFALMPIIGPVIGYYLASRRGKWK